MESSYLYAIAALLPIAAAMVIFEKNPYHALVIRGILGAVAALVYAVFGAADVALTEALVGTLLAIMLYAVAVRSSLVFRMGIMVDQMTNEAGETPSTKELIAEADLSLQQLVTELRQCFRDYHLRVELVPYSDRADLNQALATKDVHAICVRLPEADPLAYQTQIRLRRLYDIVQDCPPSTVAQVTYTDPAESQEAQP